jgi:hypothetical protein
VTSGGGTRIGAASAFIARRGPQRQEDPARQIRAGRPASLSRRTGGFPARAGSGLIVIGWTARIERGGRKGRPEAEARRLGALAAASLSPRRFDVDGGW